MKYWGYLKILKIGGDLESYPKNKLSGRATCSQVKPGSDP